MWFLTDTEQKAKNEEALLKDILKNDEYTLSKSDEIAQLMKNGQWLEVIRLIGMIGFCKELISNTAQKNNDKSERRNSQQRNLLPHGRMM